MLKCCEQKFLELCTLYSIRGSYNETGSIQMLTSSHSSVNETGTLLFMEVFPSHHFPNVSGRDRKLRAGESEKSKTDKNTNEELKDQREEVNAEGSEETFFDKIENMSNRHGGPRREREKVNNLGQGGEGESKCHGM